VGSRPVERRLPRITFVKFAACWAAFLIVAAVVLPPLDSHVMLSLALKLVFGVCGAFLRLQPRL